MKRKFRLIKNEKYSFDEYLNVAYRSLTTLTLDGERVAVLGYTSQNAYLNEDFYKDFDIIASFDEYPYIDQDSPCDVLIINSNGMTADVLEDLNVNPALYCISIDHSHFLELANWVVKRTGAGLCLYKNRVESSHHYALNWCNKLIKNYKCKLIMYATLFLNQPVKQLHFEKPDLPFMEDMESWNYLKRLQLYDNRLTFDVQTQATIDAKVRQ